MANKIPNGLYILAKDGNLNDLLTPAGSQVKVSSPGAITTIKSRLCTSDSYVWKIENILQQSGKTDTFSITAEDSTALSFDEQTTDVYLDELDVENDRQLWEIHSVGSHRFGASIVRNARIRNKFDPSIFLDIGPSNEAVGKQPTPTAARAWRFVSLAPSGGVVNTGEDPSDLKENRDWLRDMLYYFSNRFGRASDAIGLYPYENSHINYPNTGLRASGGRHF